MKMLKKLALVSAISMISAGAFAMEAMDDESMAATTGQDGITILVKPGVISRADAENIYGVTATTIGKVADPSAGYYANGDTDVNGLTIKQVVIHDDDGLGTLGTSATANSGALVIGNGNADDSTVVFADGSKPITIKLDMVGDYDGPGAGTGAMLNVSISTPRLGIKVGSISVADSNAAPVDYDADGQSSAPSAEVDGSTHSGLIEIASSMEIVMGDATTNIQLGNEAQGAMIVLDTALIGGLAINNFALNDAAGTLPGAPLGSVITGGGSIAVGSLVMTDAGGTNLTVKAKIDVGAINTSVYGGATLTSVNANLATAIASINQVPVSVRDSVTNTVTGGTTTTYAALLDTANGADNILGNADDDATAAGQLATVETNAIAGVRASSLSTLETGAQNAYNGLVIQLTKLGDGTNGVDLALNNVGIGSDTDTATAGWQGNHIGDVQMLGLNLNGTTLVISGH